MTLVKRTLYVTVGFSCCVDGRKSFTPTPRVFKSIEELDDSKISLHKWEKRKLGFFKEYMDKEIEKKCRDFASAHRLCGEVSYTNVTSKEIVKYGPGPVDEIEDDEFVQVDGEEVIVPKKSSFEKDIKRKAYIMKIEDSKTGKITEREIEKGVSRKWTTGEMDFLSDVYGKISIDIVSNLLGRSKKSIWSKAGSMRKRGLI